ncbi:MAG: VCBS repeat-containing protein, partial [Balneolaceae bacterium]|nr:VCBS repeat-containing protein [Balneolaceae bacterium]
MAILILFASCSKDITDEDNHLFESLSSSQTAITFENNLVPTEEFNMYVFRSFYNGGGVAIGDINNDGLQDIFFTGNMVSNRLYLNQGDFRFEDVTEKAGLLSEGTWTAGVSFADLTGNGLMDIYITKSGRPGGERRHNELFINKGIPENTETNIPIFEERSAEYGLDVTGLSTQAVFFDYDGDSDLDMYLLNTSFDAIGDYENISGEDRQIPDPEGGSKLFRNASTIKGGKEGGFTEVTDEAGIYSSHFAFGLSASVGDLNRDGWPDIYVANDFFERDYLYINNRDGTFREVLEDQMNTISLSSMGSDIADLTNNGWPDVYVVDMYPHTESRKKVKMQYETFSEYQTNVENGFHHQMTRNTLQLNLGYDPQNNGLPLFSEVSRLSGVEASDWSWAVLMADYDHNGYTDIYITNGIYKDLLDQDYIKYRVDPNEIRGMIKSGRDDVIMTLMERIPSEPVGNILFAGVGGLEFSNRGEAWGLADPGFSSGAAWADLDGDGALDLVVS